MSTAATIASMEKLAQADRNHPAVAQFAGEVDRRAQEVARRNNRAPSTTDRLASLEALIRDRIAYVPDPAEYELVRSPGFLLEHEPEGDCDDMICLARSVTLFWNLPSHMMRLGNRTDRADPFSHVVLVVPAHVAGTPGDVVLDPTVSPHELAGVLSMMTVSHLH